MSSMKQPTYIEEALRRIDSEIFAEPNQMKIILQKELQGLGERIIEEMGNITHNIPTKGDYSDGFFDTKDKIIDIIRSLTLPDNQETMKEITCGRCGSNRIKTLPNDWRECQDCGNYQPIF